MVMNLAVKWFFLVVVTVLLLAAVACAGSPYVLQSNGYYSNSAFPGKLYSRKLVKYYQNGCWREYYKYDEYIAPQPVVQQQVTINYPQQQEVKTPPPKGWRDQVLDAHLKDIEHLQALEKSDLEHQQYMEAIESLNKLKGEYQQQEQQQPYNYNVQQYSSEYPAYATSQQSLINPLQDAAELISSFGAYSKQQLEVTEKIGQKYGQMTESSLETIHKQSELLTQVEAYKQFLQAMKDNTVRETETNISITPAAPTTVTPVPDIPQPKGGTQNALVQRAEKILQDRCVHCHKGPEAPKGLNLESGLNSVPSEKVLDFIARLRTEDQKKVMPPPNDGEPLEFDEILTLELAIKEILK